MPRPNYRQREKMRKRLKAMGMNCAICGKPIDYSLTTWTDPRDGKVKRHPLSFEYDHRVPFANGGDNSFENAQPAHRICNQRKGAMQEKHGGHAEAPKQPIITSRDW